MSFCNFLGLAGTPRVSPERFLLRSVFCQVAMSSEQFRNSPHAKVNIFSGQAGSMVSRRSKHLPARGRTISRSSTKSIIASLDVKDGKQTIIMPTSDEAKLP